MLRYTGSAAVNFPAPRLADEAFDIVDPPCAVGRAWSAWSPTAYRHPPVRGKPNPLVTKLQKFARLEERDIAALDSMATSPKTLNAGHILIHENSIPDQVSLIVSGMACRYKLLPGGQRQILGFLMPGDLCDVPMVNESKADHSVALLGASEVVKHPSRRIIALLVDHPRIERALALSTLLDIAILREWLLNIGQRNALEKVAHFFCEMQIRMETIGEVAEDGSFDMPVNQSALADATGLTTVHINRTLQKIRNDGLIHLAKRRLTLLDPLQLAIVAGFDPSYLQIKPCQR